MLGKPSEFEEKTPNILNTKDTSMQNKLWVGSQYWSLLYHSCLKARDKGESQLIALEVLKLNSLLLKVVLFCSKSPNAFSGILFYTHYESTEY